MCFVQTLGELVGRLSSARRVVVVGNGGIALSIVHEVRSVDVFWAVKDSYIGNTFFDASASAFFLDVAGRDIVSLSEPAAASADAAAPPLWGWRTMSAEPVSEQGRPGCGRAEGPHLQSRPDLAVVAAVAGAAVSDSSPLTSSSLAREADDDSGSAGALPPRASGRRWKRVRVDPAQAPLESRATAAPPQPKLLGLPQPAVADGTPRVLGSALGPSLVDTLRELRGLPTVKAAAAAAASDVEALAEGVRAACGGSGGGLPRAGSALPAPHPVFLDTSSEVVALWFRDKAPAASDGAGSRWRRVGSEPLPPPAAADASTGLWQEFHGGCTEAARADACGRGGSGPSAAGWPVYVLLSSGRVVGCDFVVSAIGVDAAAPNAAWLPSPAFQRDDASGGLIVNRSMQAIGHEAVFAAGDAATMRWPVDEVLATPDGQLPLEAPSARRPLWFQMRLWNTARLSGAYAARCMAGALDPLESESGGLAFELFAHVTRLLGFKVVVLGLFNGQGLGAACASAMDPPPLCRVRC